MINYISKCFGDNSRVTLVCDECTRHNARPPFRSSTRLIIRSSNHSCYIPSRLHPDQPHDSPSLVSLRSLIFSVRPWNLIPSAWVCSQSVGICASCLWVFYCSRNASRPPHITQYLLCICRRAQVCVFNAIKHAAGRFLDILQTAYCWVLSILDREHSRIRGYYM